LFTIVNNISNICLLVKPGFYLVPVWQLFPGSISTAFYRYSAYFVSVSLSLNVLKWQLVFCSDNRRTSVKGSCDAGSTAGKEKTILHEDIG